MDRERAWDGQSVLLHHPGRAKPLNAPPEREPEHVLVVEDSAAVSSAMRILFESAGHRVSIAASIAEALSVGTQDPAALVLLDLTLPDGNGLTAVAPLLAAGCRTILALTG